MGHDPRQSEFDAWFATQPRPTHTVVGYEHAWFIWWAMANPVSMPDGSRTHRRVATLPPPAMPVMPAVEAVTPAVEAVTPDLLSWRQTRTPAFPLGAHDPPPMPPDARPATTPTRPPKRTVLPPMHAGPRRMPGERWLPVPHPDPASLPVDRIDAFCDGSGFVSDYAPNGEPGGIGVVLLWGNIVLAEDASPIGPATNIVAELRAIRRTIHLASKMFPGSPLTLYSDSEWSIAACVPSCDWNIRDANLLRLVDAIRRQYVQHGAVTFRWCKGHRGLAAANGDIAEARIIRGNARADELATEGRRKNTAAMV